MPTTARRRPASGSCAQRPKASERELLDGMKRDVLKIGRTCSTPEGIGAGITVRDGLRVLARLAVLNARRHRSGNYNAGCIRCICQLSVLNARRHRSGNYDGIAPFAACSSACSTREGIGAGITTASRPSRPALPRAQRAKASERELQYLTPLSLARFQACSTPEGIGAGITGSVIGAAAPRLARCSTREGIGAGIADLLNTLMRFLLRVLNARRHRSGNYTSDRPRAALALARAQRPKASERELPLADLESDHRVACSTPEGIGAGITSRGASSTPTHERAQLNARRHRSGNYEVHIATHHLGTPGAQRPKASERELRAERWRRDADLSMVLNARRHRSGNYLVASSPGRSRALGCSTPEGIGAGITWHEDVVVGFWKTCSTPEGIGAGITHDPPRAGAAPSSAQRPKASERELRGALSDVLRSHVCSTPEGIGAGITSVAARVG